MSGPGYAYLVGKTTEKGAWAKVGIAASTLRVRDHERQGWKMLIRTIETGILLENPRILEQSVLNKFPDRGVGTAQCGICGAPKPEVGRTGTDGLTEVIHLDCHPGLQRFFEESWTIAPRIEQGLAWRVDFDPNELRPGGFTIAREPWRQPPRMNPGDYGENTCNVICIRGVPSVDVIGYLDSEWEAGTVDLRRALWQKFGERVCNATGKSSPKAKGTGLNGRRVEVEGTLAQMTKFPDVEVVLISVRKPGMLYAYVCSGQRIVRR